MTAEEGAALMARAVELSVTLGNIVFEAAEEGRENRIFILLSKRIDLTAVLTGSKNETANPQR